MFLIESLLTLLLALSITGSPIEVRNSTIILPLTRRSNGTIDLVQHDKARVAALQDYRAESISIFRDSAWGKYSVTLSVGSPPRTYNVIVDTGSAVTWIGASSPYSETGVSTGQGVRALYSGIPGGPSSSFSGTIFRDTVTLGGGLAILNYDLAVAYTWNNVISDGVLGLGPEDLTLNTLTDRPGVTYPTFTNCLVSAGAIDHNIVGIFFRPTPNLDTNVGELSFGGVDYTKFIGSIVYTPVTEITPSANYWGIDQSITYGDTEILDNAAGFIDSGTTFIKIAPYAYHRYQAATGATFDQPTGLLRITLDRYNVLQVLQFRMSHKTLSLVANAQIWPRSINNKLTGGETDGIYLIIANLGTAARPGLDFVVGYTFMQRFYIVLNDHFGVGFAETPFTTADIN
ncbi:aspartic peptidase domain-containing protein [Suillus spraguei]|nr:aspartic peptidase domain-containing protein [Suillus spraguei]